MNKQPKDQTLLHLQKKVREFVRERDWLKFHSPKNISMSIAIESAELMEHFQWLSENESKELLRDKNKRGEIEDELADIAIYILDFCEHFGVDLEKSILSKLDKTAKKYPVRLVKGKAHKYTYYAKKGRMKAL
ncbi:MAG: nucleotide pyrophosphohydrolase [Candidatus Omnitrophota bacterium]|nr:nucleotide pyrophosphohydrolase [Candidatus Omnitrophota bacterium]